MIHKRVELVWISVAILQSIGSLPIVWERKVASNYKKKLFKKKNIKKRGNFSPISFGLGAFTPLGPIPIGPYPCGVLLIFT